MSNNECCKAEKYAEIFKALSNPHRLKIFLRLACCGTDGMACKTDKTCECVGDLSSNLGIAQSTISHHMKELHRAGLINCRRNGQRIECSVDEGILGKLADFFKNPEPE
ncbi:MAG: ArsR/SmtB family transcription factor [Dehalococcoidia bacterium]|jgi:ArsR family transcriptional regulator, arsenate/arsenite/antimonite-responsive transcriptional repressor